MSDQLRQRISELERELGQMGDDERQARRLIDWVTDAVFLVDHEGLIEFVNQHACDVLGYSHEELIGLPIPEVEITVASLEAFHENRKKMEPGVPRTLLGRHRKKDGSEFPVEVRIGVVELAGHVKVVGLARDITERLRTEEALRESGARLAELNEQLANKVKQATAELRTTNEQLRQEIAQHQHTQAMLEVARDAAEESDRTKSRFLATMSHELRTPLNATIGYAELLQEEAEEAALDHFIPDLQRIQGAGKVLLSIIEQVLIMSELEAGKVDLEWAEVDLDALVEELAERARTLADRRGNRFELSHARPLGSCWIDGAKVRRILLSVLDNAASFTERGTIGLSARRHEGDGHPRLELIVSDTGVGMTADQLAKVFLPFTQADSSGSREHGGIGLGLAISRRLCDSMSGSIEAESEPGNGSTIRVRLPARPAKPRSACGEE